MQVRHDMRSVSACVHLPCLAFSPPFRNPISLIRSAVVRVTFHIFYKAHKPCQGILYGKTPPIRHTGSMKENKEKASTFSRIYSFSLSLFYFCFSSHISAQRRWRGGSRRQQQQQHEQATATGGETTEITITKRICLHPSFLKLVRI